MKTLLILFMLPALSLAQTPTPAPAFPIPMDAPPSAAELADVKTVDPIELTKDPDAHAGKIVKLRFTARAFDTIHFKDKLLGEVGVRVGINWSMVHVELPQKQEPWFIKIPDQPAGPYFVYARIHKEGISHAIMFLGRAIHNGPNGPEIVW